MTEIGKKNLSRIRKIRIYGKDSLKSIEFIISIFNGLKDIAIIYKMKDVII